MASTYHELLAEYEYLGTQDGQVHCIIDRTGFSDDCVRRVLVHLNTQPLFGEEWDLETQARRAGLSFEDYAVAMAPLMQMSPSSKHKNACERLRHRSHAIPALFLPGGIVLLLLLSAAFPPVIA